MEVRFLLGALYFRRVGRTANAPVLKTGGRNPLEVRILHPPPSPAIAGFGETKSARSTRRRDSSMANLTLSTPLPELRGVGPGLQRKLKKLGIITARDLLFHFPHRYEDFSDLVPISEIKLNQKCCIKGKIISIDTMRTFRRKMFITTALIQDGTGSVRAVWFNRPYITKILKQGDFISLAGKTLLGKNGIYLSNPAHEKLKDGADLSVEQNINEGLTHTGRIIPVYPETEGLSSRWLRALIKMALSRLENKIPDAIPLKIQKEYDILPIQKAIWQVHFPESREMAEKAKQSLAFRELFHISLAVLRERARLNSHKAIAVPLDLPAVQKFVKSFPFTLTDAQKKAAWQILKDMEKPRPMNRLLQGDVGSGKTVVALTAALNAMRAGYQIAFMAPTEILAKQHFQTASQLLAKFKVDVGLLTGKTDYFISKKLPNQIIEISRAKLLEKSRMGKMPLLIGTHALIQDKVTFGNLALVVLDEQHRFGVKQRAKLLTRGAGQIKIPHLLSMTATPIPRTLALTLYGDLDLSLIDELPKGRKKIITKIILPQFREEAYEFIRKEARGGRQVFVICPRIESQNSKFKSQNENTKLKIDETKKDILGWSEAKAVKAEYEKLSKEIFPDLRVGMLHGKMGVKEKERTMRNFSAGGGKNKIDILVSTSVIEVGVDVPNATVMMIEGAERFGLAQLHQFRGRVGRAEHQSYCLLLTESPAQKTKLRLKALLEHDSGFELAEKDLSIRGPGDFSGSRQWGIPDLVMDSLKDLKLVEKTRQAAKETLTEDPYLKKYPLLRTEIEKFRERIHLE